ncbi:hypothetical protein GWK47_055227 [Chionoecetes opilio]|uniref:Uncharacterized protein n=1 Tax=Chionoecetes opilio TaxID=41210 RepID=A0A8J4Y4A9_CHIOP|nr:hypothetical protein GWK47_055227 [Chionoecetes opilio]
MECSPLAWSSCPPSYLGLLDRVQARAQRLARLKAPEVAAQIIQPLQQRRDVAGMCVMYKAHRMQLLQLAELRLNPRARPSHATRAAHNIDHQVTVPFARTEHYLRSFLPRYGRLWNTLVRQTDLHLTTSLHAFKSALPVFVELFWYTGGILCYWLSLLPSAISIVYFDANVLSVQ